MNRRDARFIIGGTSHLLAMKETKSSLRYYDVTRVIRLTADVWSSHRTWIHRSAVSWIHTGARRAAKRILLEPLSGQAPIVYTLIAGVGNIQAAVAATDAFCNIIWHKHEGDRNIRIMTDAVIKP